MSQPLELTQSRRGREGSPWTGVGAVMLKEMADHLTSARMRILEVLIVLTAAGTVYAAMQNLRESVGEDRFLLLRLFTSAREPLPAFVGLLGFLIPLIAIALAFDSVNGEFSRRTMSRVLAQPIYRDGLLLGKFLAGLIAPVLRPVDFPSPEAILAQARLELALTRLSPNTLYTEVTLALMQPSLRSVGLGADNRPAKMEGRREMPRPYTGCARFRGAPLREW